MSMASRHVSKTIREPAYAAALGAGREETEMRVVIGGGGRAGSAPEARSWQ
jgi:hypothetical protein